MKYALILIFLIVNSPGLHAQKPVIDSAVLDKWPEIDNPITVSNNGKYVIYKVSNIPVGSKTLVIQALDKSWKREFADVDRGDITSDSKFFFLLKPHDSLCIINLTDHEEKYICDVSSYQLPAINSEGWFAYRMNRPSGQVKLVNLFTGIERSFSNATIFLFDKSGKTFIVESKSPDVNNQLKSLKWLRLSIGDSIIIWQGEKSSHFSFDDNGIQLAFLANRSGVEGKKYKLWYFKQGMDKAIDKMDNVNEHIDSQLVVDPSQPIFSKDGNKLFFKLIEETIQKPTPNSVKVDVWSYKDIILQPAQLAHNIKRTYYFVINLVANKLIRLENEDDKLIISPRLLNNNHYALINEHFGGSDFWWQESARSSVYLISTDDGSRRLFKKDILYPHDWDPSLSFKLSPAGNYIIYYDPLKKNYFTYHIDKNITCNITKNISVSWREQLYNNEFGTDAFQCPVGLAAWKDDESSVFIYDNYDIWEFDPRGIHKPKDITNGYGRTHYLKFRFLQPEIVITRQDLQKDFVFIVFDTIAKRNGFYTKKLDKPGNPFMISMERCLYYIPGPFAYVKGFIPIKAKDNDTWILMRQNFAESPNLFWTKDFANVTALTEIYPEKKYNWLTAELVRWKNKNGQLLSGILYKPENFNPTHKYPLLFNYYEERSDELYTYNKPGYSHDNINIPFFVSNNYLVFVPDIHYKIGATGESALDCLTSAAKYLAKYPWINKTAMGIQGHSFGGYETNYIVTHSHMFAAAAEASGVTDLISAYGELSLWGTSRIYQYEIYQGRQRKVLSISPKTYIAESPVLNAHKVTIPFLMMHNKSDGAVPFSQAEELFTALRRLKKKVWLLQYDEGGHGVDGRDALDYTIRLRQFFDHYLKGTLPPLWMTEGVPARLKGIKTGYELDHFKKP